MKLNVGLIDSTLRVMVGFALLGTAFLVPAPVKWFAWAGFLIFAISGFTGRCPLYGLFGINTCRRTEG